MHLLYLAVFTEPIELRTSFLFKSNRQIETGFESIACHGAGERAVSEVLATKVRTHTYIHTHEHIHMNTPHTHTQVKQT